MSLPCEHFLSPFRQKVLRTFEMKMTPLYAHHNCLLTSSCNYLGWHTLLYHAENGKKLAETSKRNTGDLLVFVLWCTWVSLARKGLMKAIMLCSSTCRW